LRGGGVVAPLREAVMHVARVMNRSIVVCRPDESLADVAERMWTHDVGWLPVVDAEGRVVGVVTERDTCSDTHPENGQPMKVAEVIAGEPPCCRPSDTLADVALVMRQWRVLRLPVVDDEGRLVGLLAFDDVALELPIGTALDVRVQSPV
jgi:CBS domain-containing protein